VIALATALRDRSQTLFSSAMKIGRNLAPPPPLAELSAEGPIALFLDFDGTLVEIAPEPDEIRVGEDLVPSLECLAGELGGRLAIVSGRSVADLERHLGSLRLAHSGSHGVERLDASGEPVGDSPQPLPEEVRAAMRDYATREGLLFENKRYGAALHFRARPELGAEAVRHAEQVAAEAGMTTKQGHFLVEVLHSAALKSSAVRAFMERPPFRDARPVFIGDDITDEDGFRAVSEMGGFGIIVGNRIETGAHYRLDNPSAVRAWLTL
jgi:trehalose 6-phosphate phosphatase